MVSLEHNIVESRREEIAANFKKSAAEHKAGKLKFSSNIKNLKKRFSGILIYK